MKIKNLYLKKKLKKFLNQLRWSLKKWKNIIISKIKVFCQTIEFKKFVQNSNVSIFDIQDSKTFTYKEFFDSLKIYIPLASLFATGYTVLLLIFYFNHYGISIFDIGGENSLISLIPFIIIGTILYLLLFIIFIMPFFPNLYRLGQIKSNIEIVDILIASLFTSIILLAIYYLLLLPLIEKFTIIKEIANFIKNHKYWLNMLYK